MRATAVSSEVVYAQCTQLASAPSPCTLSPGTSAVQARAEMHRVSRRLLVVVIAFRRMEGDTTSNSETIAKLNVCVNRRKHHLCDVSVTRMIFR